MKQVGVFAAREAVKHRSLRVNVSLERDDGQRRLWIEFEVSRADPVANHAKFATAHLFQPQRSRETFVSMVSWHVAKGRRNLAANTISLMRHVGMSAFQTTLFPNIPPNEIRRLNHLDRQTLAGLKLAPDRAGETVQLGSRGLQVLCPPKWLD